MNKAGKNCAEYSILISAYYDSELSANDRQRVEDHIDTCEYCAAALYMYREVSLAVKESLTPPPEALSGRVMADISGAADARSTGKTRHGYTPPHPMVRIILSRYVPAAACLVLILLALPRLQNLNRAPTAPASSSAPFMLSESPAQMDTVAPADAPMGANNSIQGETGGAPAPEAAPMPSAASSAAGAQPDSSYDDEVIQETIEMEAPEEEAPQDADRGTDPYDEVLTGNTPAQAPPQIANDTSEIPHSAPEAPLQEMNISGYFAVITVTGELPGILAEFDMEDAGNGLMLIHIPRETAIELISTDIDGVETELGDSNAETALVQFYKDQ